jgi:hypothetical protein
MEMLCERRCDISSHTDFYAIYREENFGASWLADVVDPELPSYPRFMMKFSGIHSAKTLHMSP